MEMQEITPEEKKSDEKEDDGGASEPAVETKAEAAEEAEADHYSKLLAQPEDIYSEAFYSGATLKEAEPPTAGNVRRYRAVCILLSALCLILLLVVIILSLKLQNGSTVCPGPEGAIGDSSVPTCSYEQCRTHIETIESQRHACHHCPEGWVSFQQSCFFLSTTRLSWEESQRNCSSRGASLAIITKQEEQKRLTEKGNVGYWIGLNQDGDSWAWFDSTPLRQSYWAPNEPRDGRGEKLCGLLSADLQTEKNWMTTRCHTYSYFICQLKMA